MALYTQLVCAVALPDFVRDAVQADPQVREQVHFYRQVVEDHEVALSGWRPSLDLSATTGLVTQKDPTSDSFDRSQADLTLTQNLFNGFDTRNHMRQAKSRMTSAIYQLYDTADNAALEAIRAYLDLLSEISLIALADRNVKSHERILSQIQEQSAAGIGHGSDIEQTEGRLASAKASLVGQQNNLQDALTRLHKVLGRYLQTGEISEPEVPTLPPGTIEELIEEALLNHPALRSARQNIQAARFDYQRSRRSNFPQLDLQLQQSVGNNIGGIDNNRNERSVMLSLQYNLYRGGADLAEQRKKISELQELQAFQSRVRRQVIDALRLAWMADRALAEQIPFLNQHVKKAQQTLDLYHEEFFLQKRDLLDVLDAESELNSAQKRATQAHYDALAARFRVYESLGKLFQSLNLAVEASKEDLHIADIRAKGVDSSELDTDRDRDEHTGDGDQCDNSRSGTVVDNFGCETRIEPRFGYLSTNGTPTANDDFLDTEPNTALSIAPEDLLKNDTDPDGDRLSIDGFSKPNLGSVIKDADGYLIYAPPRNYTGSAKFTYTIRNMRGATSSAQVAVRIGAKGTGNFPSTLRVVFTYKQLSLNRESQDRLDKMLNDMRHVPNIVIDIRTYTDDIGSHDYNQRLSERRAQALRQLLIGRGFDGNRIHAAGMGESDPIADNATEEGRELNRRGEITFELDNQQRSIAVEPHPIKNHRSEPNPLDKTDVKHIQFAYKQAGLTPDSMAIIDLYTEQILRSPRALIEIRAYTDNVGSESYNRQLSSKRAEEIKQLFIERGVDGSRIQIYGMGESDPIADNSTEEGKARNRRAELHLHLEQQN
ncbi:MAG: TolC family outer membrane protein [Gammaproteobacteria bacterium]|nr:TolC family outer membrane protein [Gammaproteobacteria bacterium]